MSTNVVVKEEKKEWMPHAYVIIFALLLFAVLLTWIVPAGAYNRVMNAATGREVVVPTTFHWLAQSPVGFTGFFMAIQKGFIAGATLLSFLLIIGGSFGVFNATGAMEKSIARLVARFSGKSYEIGLVAIVYIFFFWAQSLFGMGGIAIIGFLPFFISMCVSLGYDSIVAASLVLLTLTMGNTGAISTPTSIGVAQAVAGLPIYSGAWFRGIVAVVILIISLTYLYLYARKIKKDPTKSLVHDIDVSHIKMTEDPTKVVMNKREIAVMTVFAIFIFALLFCSIKFKFGIPEMTAMFLALAIAIGIVGRLNTTLFFDKFIEGAKDMMFGCLMVGFAMGIQQILIMGNVMDSVIYGLTLPLSHLPHLLIGPMMVVVQSLINFVVPSSSAMAVVSMPIMAPLADVLGIQRQTAVFAFQFGDGITNLVQPNWETQMMVLGMAYIPFQRWVKFTAPLVGILIVLSFFIVGLAEYIKVGPF